MSFSFRISVKGDKELARKLGVMSGKMQPSMKREMHKAVRLVLRSAKRHLTGGNPLHVLGGPRSQHLRQTLAIDVSTSGKKVIGLVGTAVTYGPVHEYGAIIENGFGKGIRIMIPKRPWLEPSLEENRKKIMALFGDAVTAEIKRAGLA